MDLLKTLGLKDSMGNISATVKVDADKTVKTLVNGMAVTAGLIGFAIVANAAIRVNGNKKVVRRRRR